MKRIKTGLTGFILGDWLGMPYRGKGKGTFKPMWTKSYLRGDKCSGNTSMLLCALDSRCNLELYQQNLRDWYLWGIERSGFFNGREKWVKGFESQMI